jgi:superfamily II DNA or RNA helicase
MTEYLKQELENLLGNSFIKEKIEEIYAYRKTLDSKANSIFTNLVRNQVQREAYAAVLNSNHRNCIVALATGGGKSKIAIDLFNTFADRYEQKSLLVVPTLKLKNDNWLEEFTKWNTDYSSIEKICYKSCIKYAGQVYPLIVLDEGHNLTAKSSSILKDNQYAKCLYLSATLPENNLKREMLKNKGFKVVYQLSLEECVKLGFVADYEITVVKVPLETEDKKYHLYRDNAKVYVSEFEMNKYHNETVKRILDNPYAKSALKKNVIMNRMQFIYSLRSKTEALKFIKDNVIPEDVRTLYFCGSIKQAEELSSYHYHSKSCSKHYDAFKKEEINHLSSVSSLNEGHTFPNLNTVVISQVQSSEKDLVQRIGRALRKEKGKVYILISEGTQDEIWLKNALTFFDGSKVTEIAYENLKNQFNYDLHHTN